MTELIFVALSADSLNLTIHDIDFPLCLRCEGGIIFSWNLYTKKMWTLRMIADAAFTNHHKIKRMLVSSGIEITPRPTLKPYTEEHRRKVGNASRGRKTNLGKTMPRSSLYKNMRAHLKYNVSLEWLESFEDIEKLKFLNKSIARDRDRVGFTNDTYKTFIEKFYNNTQFNRLYEKWILSNRDKWLRPSLDHVNPKSKNGSLVDIDNLQFLTWLENRTKVDMPNAEWNKIKQKIMDYFS